MAVHSSIRDTPPAVLFEENSWLRTVILNRPQKLNTLTYEMVSLMLEKIIEYEKDPNVGLIILKGNGKGFCAGGDVVGIIKLMKSSSWRYGARFYEKQFTLDFVLATYTKPLVCIMHGVVMGGGAGMSVYATFRIVTEKTVFAMPEAAIGLIPDMGASQFLSRLPGYFGEYLGLTGARLNGAEMLACGLATHFVPSKDLHLLEKELQAAPSSDPAAINELIMKFSHCMDVKQDSPYKRLEILDKCFSKMSVEEILASLHKQIAESGSDKWIVEAIKSVQYASPTSLKIFLKSIRRGRKENLEQSLVREHNIVCHIIRGSLNNDLYEGARALLFDKDKDPKWEPPKLELVTDAMVEIFFNRIEDGTWKPLQLRQRSHFTKNIVTPKL